MINVRLGYGCGLKVTLLTPAGSVCDLRKVASISAVLRLPSGETMPADDISVDKVTNAVYVRLLENRELTKVGTYGIVFNVKLSDGVMYSTPMLDIVKVSETAEVGYREITTTRYIVVTDLPENAERTGASPKISDHNTWLVYNDATKAYEDSGVVVTAELEKYVKGQSVEFAGIVGVPHSSKNEQIQIKVNEGQKLVFALSSDKKSSIAEVKYTIFTYYGDGTTDTTSVYAGELAVVRPSKEAIAFGCYYPENFITEDCTLKFSYINDSNLLEGLLTHIDKEIDDSANCISLIATNGFTPNIDTISKTIDFGADPILTLGSKTYNIKNIQPNVDKYRKVLYYDEDSNSGAVRLVFDTETFEFKSIAFNKSTPRGCVAIGGIRLEYGTFRFVSANFPFIYRVDGKEVWSKDVETISDTVFAKKESLSLFTCYKTSNRLRFSTTINTDFLVVNVIKVPTSFRYAITIGKHNADAYITGGFDSGWKTNAQMFDLSGYAINYGFIGIAFSRTDNGDLSEDDINRVYSEFAFELKYSNVRSKELSTLRGKTSLSFIAHRGVHMNNIPENSLDSYRYAGYCGFDYVETDILPTADDELVLMHDDSINRTMCMKSDYSEISETVNVREKTLAELRRDYVLKSNDARMRREIPTLEEFLVTCKSSGVFPIIELKSSGTTNAHIEKACDLCKTILGEGNFGFTSFSTNILDYIRSISSTTLLLYINNGVVGTTNSITGKGREDEYTWWYPSFSGYGLNAETVGLHHKHGVKVAVWTTPVSLFDELMKMGVDSLAGDYISPNIDGLVGYCYQSHSNFSDFVTNGGIKDKTIILEKGQIISCGRIGVELGGYYISVIGRGSFTLSAYNLNVEIDNDKTDRYIYQGLLIDEVGLFEIKANEASVIEYIDFQVVKF